MRGFSAILATILLVIIVVSIVGLVYTFATTIFTTTTVATTNQTKQVVTRLGEQVTIVSIYSNIIYVRNVGTENIDLTNIGVFVDNKIVNFTPDNPILASGEIGALTLQKDGAIGNIGIVTGSGTISSKGPSVTAYDISELETMVNSQTCARKMYVLENKKMKLFTGIPNIINSSVTLSGSGGSWIGVCDDLGPVRNIYVASPLRIWTKNADSPNYRVNNTILDDTAFRNQTNTGAFNFTARENISFSLTADSAILRYVGKITASLEPEVTYTLKPDKNYVKVELTVTNVGLTPRVVRLQWNGDTDPPLGGGTWRTREGLVKSFGVSSNLETDTWMASISNVKNDIFGIVAGPDVEINNTQSDSFAYVRRKTIETLNAGQKSTLIFYMVSDFKGPAGNEWKPVEDAYNEMRF